MDFVSKKKRSKIMKSIKSKNTKPEIYLRKYLFSKGLRYKINYKKLPGKPDIVFVSSKLAIFVHGCFWHQHKDCEITNIPESNSVFWSNKFEKNIDRDIRNKDTIEELGWKVIIVWECEILDKNRRPRDLGNILGKIKKLF
jgi:DNA mismatch endonuclease, patch repair protein